MEQMMAGRTEDAVDPDALAKARMAKAQEAFRDELKNLDVAQSEIEKPKRFIVVLVDVATDPENPMVLDAVEQFETGDPREAFAKMQEFFERTLKGEGRWVSCETIPYGQDSVVNYPNTNSEASVNEIEA